MRGIRTWFILVLILCCLFAGSAAVHAETPDLSGYSDAEIVELLAQVQQELVTRRIEKTASLPSGKYVGGKALPAGSYTLTCKPNDKESGIVWLSAAADDLENDWPSLLYEYVGHNQELIVHIDLEEGGTLCLPFPAELTICAGILFK